MAELRAHLRANPDGLTTAELTELTGRDKYNVLRTLKLMPDAYVDRWEGPKRGQYASVFCVVVPPPDCPHPTRGVESPHSLTKD